MWTTERKNVCLPDVYSQHTVCYVPVSCAYNFIPFDLEWDSVFRLFHMVIKEKKQKPFPPHPIPTVHWLSPSGDFGSVWSKIANKNEQFNTVFFPSSLSLSLLLHHFCLSLTSAAQHTEQESWSGISAEIGADRNLMYGVCVCVLVPVSQCFYKPCWRSSIVCQSASI